MCDKTIGAVETTQGNMVKSLMGLGKRARSSPLLKALNIPKISDIIAKDTASVTQRIFCVPSPLRDLQTYLLSQYCIYGSTVCGTLLERVIKLGMSPLQLIFPGKGTDRPSPTPPNNNDGLVDSLRFVLNHDDFNNPNTSLRQLAFLLTKSF